MNPDGNDAKRRRRGTKAAHRQPRKPSAVSRTIVVGSAAACIGAGFNLAIPTAEALSILLPSRDSAGNAATVQINILEGNIFNPQFAMNRDNVSNNTLIGNAIVGRGNGRLIDALLGGGRTTPLVIGGAAGAGNTTQINILSFNIINPQVAIGGGNTSHNKTINNVAAGNGNKSTTKANGTGSLFGMMTGNGNAIQLSFGSGNIFNPQWSLGGQNVSNNTAVTNVAAYNGNGSQTGTTNGARAALGGLTGNGNAFQGAAFVSNIFNPQFSSGNGNSSNNTAITNDASENGNNSQTTGTTTGGGIDVGSRGNGNATQAAVGSSNIYNDQWNVGIASIGRRPTSPATVQQSAAVGANRTAAAGPSPSGENTAQPGDPVRNVVSNIQRTTGAIAKAATGRRPSGATAASATAPSATGANAAGAPGGNSHPADGGRTQGGLGNGPAGGD